MRILVIEDNLDIKEVLDYILQDEGHEAIPCSDGSSLSALDTIKPDLILMDELLLGVRGSDLIVKLKADRKTRDIPVVLISAVPHLKGLAEKCGANAYLEKPFNIDALTDILKRYS